MKTHLTLLFLFTFFLLNAQLTVRGVILDENHQPIPFVNIIVEKSTLGTITDDNGNFSITLKKNRGRLEISSIGYEVLLKKVTKKTGVLKIILKEKADQLEEIIIVSRPKKRLQKKENPAYRILKEIWKRKKVNGLKRVNYYQFKQHQTTEIGLNNLDSILLKGIFRNDYQDILSQLPFNETGINYYLPLYYNELVKNVYGNTIINKKREDIEAEKTRNVQSGGFAFQRMANSFNSIDIYKNNIPILKKSFVSPISTTGFETYDYVLYDSIVENNSKKYSIYFFPRRNGDLAFEGSFWVSDKSFSITEINMKIRGDINLNFVRGLTFKKEYTIKNDSIFLPKLDMYHGDFTLTDKDDRNKGLSIKKTTVYSEYQFEKPLENDFYDVEVIKYRPDQFFKEDSYWNKTAKNQERKDTYTLIENIKEKKEIKKISNILNTLSRGYFTVAPNFQLGQYWNTVVRNSVEGIKLKIGFRTFKTTDDRFRISGFLGYGIKDKKYKYGIEAKYLVSYKPRIAMGIAYLKDAEQLGAKLLNTNGLNANVFDPNALFSRGDNFFISSVNRKVLQFDLEVKKNFHIGFSLAHNNITTASPEEFNIDYLDQDGKIQSKITNVSTDLYFTYTPGRFEYGYGIQQKLGKNLVPSLLVNYRKGYKGFLGGTHNYDKIQFNYSHPILLGKLGLLIATLDGGKTLGTVPLSLLSPLPANQTFWITKSTFSLINYYDYVTDTYISGHFEQHFNGLIFNKLPFIKKLNLRSLLTFKTVYGTISEANIAINKSSIKYTAPTNKLYYEYGFGLENIGYGNIRPIRIDFLWRGDHKSINGLPSPKFAVRIGVKADF